MNNRITRRRYVIGLAVVALAAASFQLGGRPEPAKARALTGGSSSDLSAWRSNFGTVSGQTARVTVANLATTSVPGLVIFRCMFFDQNGTLVAESQGTEVPAGQFRGADFLYGGFGMDGEPGTGRKQVMMEVVIQSVRGTESPESLVTVEVLDQNGKTATLPTLAQFAINGNSLD
jgi:hypothetical protein